MNSHPMVFRLGILVSHPIQYYAPWFRYLAARMDVEVFYAHRQEARGQAEAGFGVEFDWDVPLLEGYSYRWLTNVARRPGLASFGGCDTPEIHDIVRTDRFDAFLIFGWNRKSSIQTIRACRRHGVPVLMRGDSQLMTKRSWMKLTMKRLPYRWFLPRLAAHLYVGKRNKEYLRHYGVPEDRLFFSPHFVDNDFFSGADQKAETTGIASKIRSELGIPNDAFVFLFVGKMIPKKRPADHVRAFLNILQAPEGSKIHALLVGDGPLRASLERLAQPFAKRIHFAGFRNQTQIPDIYRASDALVLPSDGGETWGLVVNEAMACGIPAVVSDACGCAPDLVDGSRTGCTYPLGDVEALARRMLELKKMCENNPKLIRQALTDKMACYSMEKATEGLERALEAVAHRN